MTDTDASELMENSNALTEYPMNYFEAQFLQDSILIIYAEKEVALILIILNL